MAYATTKKQNRILCIALVVLLAAAAILIAITGSANRKKEDVPPIDSKTETKDTDSKSDAEDALGKLGSKGNSADSDSKSGKDTETKPESDDKAKSDAKNEQDTSSDKTASADASSAGDNAAEVSANVSNELPKFTVPVNGVVSKEHSIDVPVFSYTMNDYRTHTGVDLICDTGASVAAPADGIVGQVWSDPMMGVSLNLIHSGGAVTYYKGLSPETMETISAGDEVKQGEVIASVGDTALIECGDEPHLHFEMTVNGESVDPADYISFDYLSSSYED